MGCINDKEQKGYKAKKQQFQSKFQFSQNPIIRIAKQWNVQLIKQRWHDNQMIIIKNKLGNHVKKISKDNFLYLLPGLKNLSTKSQLNFYNLFNYQEEDQVSIDNFVTALIIILKSDDYELLSDMFFFVYSSSSSKNIMDEKDFNLFSKQFKEHQLQFLNQTKRPRKNSNSEIIVQKELFREIFQQYDIKTIKILFRFNLIDEERKFQKQISSFGINRVFEQTVFIIDFKWFIKWKNYMEFKYGINIKIYDNGKPLENHKSNLLTAAAKQNQKKQIKRFQSQENIQYLDPINNQRIQGQDQNQLKQNLIEFSDFISVTPNVWQQMRIIYGGGPKITKPFPHFYNKKIVLTVLEGFRCRFQQNFSKSIQYDPKQTFQEIYKKRQQTYFKREQVQRKVVYYKHPGELEWKKIQKLNIRLEDFPFQFKTFIVFLRKNQEEQFKATFNITDLRGKKIIKERIQNYGSLLTFQYEGVLQQGHVGVIMKNSVLIYLKNSKGQYVKIQKTCKQLKKFNDIYLQDYLLQGFAGLQNIGNTCYINAPLQCLLKTPYFDEYLESVNLQKSRNDLLTYQLREIYNKTQRSRDCVSMINFKNKFDQKFPFFQGSGQHDAQQFLMLLLDRLSQEQPRQSLLDNQKDLRTNKKIHNFFTGKTKAETYCLGCHKKGTSQQSFFTYSLSLPIIKETLFHYYFIDNNFKVYKYGLTINRDCLIEEALIKIQKQLGGYSSHFLVMSVFQGEWIKSAFQLDRSYKATKLQNYDTVLVCYSIKNEQTPDYEDLADKKRENTVKIQIRNRVFNQKNKYFKSFYFPFFIQIDQKMNGKQLKQTITAKVKRFINYDEFNTFKQNQKYEEKQNQNNLEINYPQFSLKSSAQYRSLNQSTEYLNHTRRNLKEKINDSPFMIQYLKNEDKSRSSCWFCKKSVVNCDKQPNPKNDCQGCEFPDQIPLYENKIFIQNFKSLIIAIDWKSETFIKNWTVEQTESFQEGKKQDKKRISNLQKLLKQTYDQEENIELRCEDQKCKYNLAIRKQRIIEAPNILILHLKRFYYQDNTFHKLKNKVNIPEQFVLPGFSQKYQLYGNVVHYGSGTGRGGHYISYAKVKSQWYRCDDEKVHFTKQPLEHLNPDTYLLFYKRKSLDKSWSFFAF